MAGYKVLLPHEAQAIEREVKMMLHAHRDCLRNRGEDTIKVDFRVSDGYYGEAFGVMRGLEALGYGYFGSANLSGIEEKHGTLPMHNLQWWFSRLENKVLEEEGFSTDHICHYCRNRYGKDDATLLERGKIHGNASA